RTFDPHLALHELIERATDFGDPDAGAAVAPRGRDLNRRLTHIAGRLRVCHVGRNDREARLCDTQSIERRGERLRKAHDPFVPASETCPPSAACASGSCSGDPEPSYWRST